MTEPFRKMHLDEEGKKQDVVTVYLNSEERELLERVKKIIEQKKDSTAIKQLMVIGANLVGGKKQAYIFSILLGNQRRNKRLGIVDYE